ncbi:Fpg/Nei family DNA glycosylase [bacterium]|nr:Fpg/Nei family DNA glycosylase [bacterium]
MPELAEVELARRQWAAFHGQKILTAETHPKARIYRDCPAPALRILEGKKLLSSKAHGKRMLFTFGPQLHLEVHLGMSGKLSTGPADHLVHKHDHLILRTSKVSLIFNDYRMFGRVMLHDLADPWAELPPQPQDSRFSVSYLRKKMTRHAKKPLKALLLDQTICPGIGNWMADEICWKLGLHPAVASGQLDPASVRKAIRFVTLGALKHVADKNETASTDGFAPGSYVAQVPPKNWLFQHRWKKGGTCPKCKTDLARDTIATRTTAWCPGCQAIH